VTPNLDFKVTWATSHNSSAKYCGVKLYDIYDTNAQDNETDVNKTLTNHVSVHLLRRELQQLLSS